MPNSTTEEKVYFQRTRLQGARITILQFRAALRELGLPEYKVDSEVFLTLRGMAKEANNGYGRLSA